MVVRLIGPQTFGLGVLYGIGENVVGSVVDVAQLARTFLLADLYDRANGPLGLGAVGPFGVLHYGIAELTMWQFGDELKAAHDARAALIQEVIYAVKNPGQVFGNIAADYADKWRQFEAATAQATVAGTFEAGRIFGTVLVDVVALLGSGVAVARAATKVPRLLRLARSRGLNAAGGGGGGAARAAAREAPLTPSQLRAQSAPAAGTAPAPAASRPAPRTKSLREQYLGRTPGKSSRTGRQVQERLENLSPPKLKMDPVTGEKIFQASDGNWYPLRQADMSHTPDAVRWWNETGRFHGPKSPDVRQWMLDPDNYTLEHYSINRSAGAVVGQTERYLPPVLKWRSTRHNRSKAPSRPPRDAAARPGWLEISRQPSDSSWPPGISFPSRRPNTTTARSCRAVSSPSFGTRVSSTRRNSG
jgi:hypothetical protein